MLPIYEGILIVSAFLFSFAGTGAASVLLKRYRVLDKPNARSNHTAPTPRGGGLGIVFALTLILLIVGVPFPLIGAFWWLTAVSFADDVRGVSKRVRIAVQITAVLWTLLNVYDGRIAPWLPVWLELPLLVLAWLWFINLFNFMDGADGLAASEAIAVAVGIAAVAWPVSAFTGLPFHGLLLAAAVAGFLLWNWHPARIFLGDAGSVPLGFFLGFLLISLAGNGYLAAALILPAYFVLDASVTLFRRLWKGERISEAHSQHAYQVAIRAGLSHDALAFEVSAVNLLLILLAAASTLAPWAAWPCFALAYGIAAGLYVRFLRYGKG